MVSSSIRRDFHTGIVDLALSGELATSSAPDTRTLMLKCAGEDPRAVLVDLNGITHVADAAWTVFPAVQRLPGFHDAAVALLLYARPDVVMQHFSADAGSPFLPIYDDRESALAAVAEAILPRRRWLHLPGRPGSAAKAREFVCNVCTSWHLEDLSDAVEVVVSELVGNAVKHAGSDIVVTLSLGQFYLSLNVHDRSRVPPRVAANSETLLQRGLGLIMVDALAAGWGTFLTGGGKRVWANFHLPGKIG